MNMGSIRTFETRLSNAENLHLIRLERFLKTLKSQN